MGVRRRRRARVLGDRPRPSVRRLGRRRRLHVPVLAGLRAARWRRSRRCRSPSSSRSGRPSRSSSSSGSFGRGPGPCRSSPSRSSTSCASGTSTSSLAAAIVLGFRAAATWALPDPHQDHARASGSAGSSFRREWRALALAVGVTGAIVAVSFALNPTAWADWIDLLLAVAGAQPAAAGPRVASRSPCRHRRLDRPALARPGRGVARPAHHLDQLVGDPAGDRSGFATTSRRRPAVRRVTARPTTDAGAASVAP